MTDDIIPALKERVKVKNILIGTATIPAVANQWGYALIDTPGFGPNRSGVANTYSTSTSPVAIAFIPDGHTTSGNSVAFAIYNNSQPRSISYIIVELE